MDNTSCVLISSCDKYSFSWNVLKHSYNKYWKDNPYPIFFITNTLKAPFGETIYCVDNKSWSDNFIYSLQYLKNIGYTTIIFLLEDYWFIKNVNNINLNSYVKVIEENRAEHIRLYSSFGSRLIKREQYNKDLDYLNLDEPYRGSLNAGIWSINTLIEMVRPGNSIWDTEHILSNESNNRRFLTVNEMDTLCYDINKNMVEAGKFTQHALEYILREKIYGYENYFSEQEINLQ